MGSLSLHLADEAATLRFGEDLALALGPGLCVALEGDLGAGKSTLARATLRALANDPSLEVPSPTFTLVQVYDLRFQVGHFDLYRIADSSELDELGFDEILETGVCLVEWPERAGDRLPQDLLRIELKNEGTGRRLTISGPERRLARIKRVLDIRAFLDTRGYEGARRTFLTGDSSFRAYERIQTKDGRGLVLMDSPARSNGPVIRNGKTYSQLVHLAEDVRPFIAVDRYLRGIGLSAPDIYEADQEQGILLVEDLGNDGVIDAERKPIAERYHEAVLCLAEYHQLPIARDLPIDDHSIHQVPAFDKAALLYEVELLLDWHIPWKRNGEQATDAEREEYLSIWSGLIDEALSGETHLVMRDYHSPNLLWLPERDGFRKIGMIDFQDAIIGPSAYDVVSLVQDARVTVERPLMDDLMETYMRAREAAGPFDRHAFLKNWSIMSAQRACRLNGLWVRLLNRDNLPNYMQHMPRTLWHLEVAFEHQTLAPLRNWCLKAGILTRESVPA
ncbi:tRNA threonylcarbamoyl adenosine modification protein YjeE [Ensifer adhaerens]|nr:tRNA threonylcarbamoyl adenosine modification protein YjeE [Ensifer adhaerens]HZG30837.1 tRNA (adenosine(37)-N6)-threonylcarbamoyltransferase complex ATPase subunit type 1 TsaE [Ensifer sp.]